MPISESTCVDFVKAVIACSENDDTLKPNSDEAINSVTMICNMIEDSDEADGFMLALVTTFFTYESVVNDLSVSEVIGNFLASDIQMDINWPGG